MSIPEIGKQKRATLAFYEALLGILSGKKYEEISVSDIVAASGYSRSAFYSNFMDKDEMLSRMLEYYTLTYVHSTYDAYCERHDQIKGSLYIPMSSTFAEAYRCQKFYHQLFRGRLPGYDLVRFQQESEKLFRTSFDIRYDDWPAEFDWDMYWFVSGMKILNYILYWDTHGWKFTPEYMAINASQLMTNISVECNPGKNLVLTKHMKKPPELGGK